MAESSRQHREPGVDVDAAAIRRARMAAGLSLADVAGHELSRTAVHRVETGKIRPSMRTLGLIAERTGTPIDALLAPSQPQGDDVQRLDLAMARLERMCMAGEHAEALVRIGELLRGAHGARVGARLHHLAGVAHVQLLDPEAGLVHLRQALAAFEQAGDDWMSVESLGWVAWALSLKEDATAAETAIEALRRCRELDPVPRLTEARILGQLASIHLARHEWEQAISAYRGAVEASAPISDLVGMSKMYEGLSIAYQGLGDLPAATAYAEKAMTLSAVFANQLALARIENNLGVLLLRTGQWREAEVHLERAMRHCETEGIAVGKSHVLLSLGQLAFSRSDHERARVLVGEAIELASDIGEAVTEALGHQWLGRIMAALGDDPESDREFELAIAMLEGLDVPRRLAECHREYAQALQQRDDLRRAVLHYQRAAELWQPTVDAMSAGDWVDAKILAT